MDDETMTDEEWLNGSADSAEHSAGEPWPEPIHLDSVAPPTIPLDALPRVLRDQVDDVARVVQVAPDLPAAIGLGVIAAACARRIEVAIGRKYVQPVNAYIAPVAASGERKGPAFRDMVAPIYDLQREVRQAAQPTIDAAAEARRFAEKRLEHLRNVAAKSNDPADRASIEAEAKQLATELRSVPARPTLVVSDRTVEKLELELAEQDGALLLADEEAGTLFAIACGRYSRDGTSNLDVYLKAYDGGVIDTGRMSRATVECTAPALSIVVTPQPVILQQLRERPELHHRGLLPRFAWVLVPSEVGHRPFADTAPRASVRAAYDTMVRRLVALPKATEMTPPRRLLITGPALDVWRDYADRVETEMRPGARLEPIREWANKHASRVARIAATFHMVELVTMVDAGITVDTISADTVSAACMLGTWLEAHALAAYDAMAADPRLDGARAVLRWIRRPDDVRTSFTAREAFSGLDRRRFPTMEDLTPCLAVLIEHGHIRVKLPPSRQPGRPGRNPSPTYEVNPATLRNAPQYPQNGPGPANADDSADSAEQMAPSGPGIWL